MEWTVEQLIDEIRKAESLDDLKRALGPSEADAQAAAERLAAMDAIWDRYGSFDAMPYHAQERYKKLQEEQTNFENQYC